MSADDLAKMSPAELVADALLMGSAPTAVEVLDAVDDRLVTMWMAQLSGEGSTGGELARELYRVRGLVAAAAELARREAKPSSGTVPSPAG